MSEALPPADVQSASYLGGRRASRGWRRAKGGAGGAGGAVEEQGRCAPLSRVVAGGDEGAAVRGRPRDEVGAPLRARHAPLAAAVEDEAALAARAQVPHAAPVDEVGRPLVRALAGRVRAAVEAGGHGGPSRGHLVLHAVLADLLRPPLEAAHSHARAGVVVGGPHVLADGELRVGRPVDTRHRPAGGIPDPDAVAEHFADARGAERDLRVGRGCEGGGRCVKSWGVRRAGARGGMVAPRCGRTGRH